MKNTIRVNIESEELNMYPDFIKFRTMFRKLVKTSQASTGEMMLELMQAGMESFTGLGHGEISQEIEKRILKRRKR